MIVSNEPWQGNTVAHHYDELDPFYRALWGEHLHHGLWRSGTETVAQATLQLLDVVARHAQLQPDLTIYDVGAGYGATARWLAAHHQVNVLAMTLSPAQHRYAQALPRLGTQTPTYLLQDWLSNDLPDQSADVVIAVESTEHMADLERCFAQIRRVLRPGGRFVICAWLACENPQGWEVRYLLEPICREGRLAGLSSMSEYQTGLRRAGLVVEQSDDVSRNVRRTWDLVLRRLVGKLATERSYWRYLVNATHLERMFVWTPVRLALAYRTGSLRYGILSGHRPR